MGAAAWIVRKGLDWQAWDEPPNRYLVERLPKQHESAFVGAVLAILIFPETVSGAPRIGGNLHPQRTVVVPAGYQLGAKHGATRPGHRQQTGRGIPGVRGEWRSVAVTARWGGGVAIAEHKGSADSGAGRGK